MPLILNYKRNMIYILHFQVKEHYLCICFKFFGIHTIQVVKIYIKHIELSSHCLLSKIILLAVFNQYPPNFYSLYNYHLLSYKLHWPYNLPTIIARKKYILRTEIILFPIPNGGSLPWELWQCKRWMNHFPIRHIGWQP